MTTNDYVPDVVVEIAFDSGWSTPAASRTWTDVSTYVELEHGISIGVGRGDEFAVADANTLNLVFDNKDGRFTPELASSPYYPNVKTGRPIRVKVTPPLGGVASTRFVGFIDSWSTAWEGATSYARTAVSATSRMARLGAAAQLRSIIEEEVLADTPALYYTFGESEGATRANDSSGNGGPQLVMVGDGGAVTFGTATGPNTDDLTAATFAGGSVVLDGKHLTAEVALTLTEAAGYWVAFAFNTTSTSAGLVSLRQASGTQILEAYITGGNIACSLTGILAGPAANDGATHVAILAVEPNELRLFVDGVLEGTDTTAIDPTYAAATLHVGQAVSTGASVLNGSMAHVAVGLTALTDARIADISQAMIDGFAGETPADRIERYAAFAGIAVTELDLDTGTPPMAHGDTTGQTPLDMMRRVEVTEGGVLFDAPGGTLTFRDRASRYQAASLFSFAADLQQVGEEYAPHFDTSIVENDVTATLSDGTVSARAVDQTSVDDNGPRGTPLELMTTDVNEPHAAAWWRVGNYAEPASRVPTLTVDLLPFSTADKDDILSLTVGSRVTVTGLPTQSPAASVDYFVEGYAESIGDGRYDLMFNVSPAAPYLTTWVLGSATRSQLGSTTRLAY